MLVKAFNRIATDIESAPDISEWRKVQLTVKAKPITELGELEEVAIEFEGKPTTPSRVTSTRMLIRSTTNGARQLFFNLDSPDNPQQQTLLPQEDEA